jgi:L-lactate dehydrogenase complex protein LldF
VTHATANDGATFAERARTALGDAALRGALGNIQTHLVEGRARAVGAVPEFEQLRDAAAEIKEHTLAHLDVYLERFAERVTGAGGTVHWATSAREANEIVGSLCRAARARLIVKGKSMVSEEIGLNDHLEREGLRVLETDLGEYIVQLRRDRPSHIVAPAVHLTRRDYAAAFRTAHARLDPRRKLDEPNALLAEARAVLREQFLTADVGITGANFLVAETGTAVIVTNEGNADLSMTLPRVHIVLASIEKVVPTLADALTLVRVLARSATGQAATAYTSWVSGPARAGDADGPQAFHVVLIDNGRTQLLRSSERDMLRCIRCGACMNHCPVYGAIGGHAYGWVYPGPMGAVLTPSLEGLAKHRDLPNASTFCGRCDSVCPVRIPLTRLMRQLREKEFTQRLGGEVPRRLLSLWGWIAAHPRLYRLSVRLLTLGLRGLARRGRIARLPFVTGWTKVRDLPAPARRSFVDAWLHRRASPSAGDRS